MIPATIALLLVAWMPATAGAASTEELEKQFLAKIDELLPGMGAEKLEDREQPQLAFERICMENSAPDKQIERAALCKAIMQRVGEDVPLPARVWLLRKVEPIGRAEVVAPLAALLGDSNPRIRELARRALANNPAPEASAALREALARSKGAAWRIALINALAFRKDTDAVPQMAKLASSAKHAKVAEAAISGLGQIGDDFSVQTLAFLRKNAKPELKAAVIDASFYAAENLIARGANAKAAEIYAELADAAQPENIRITALEGLATAKGADAIPQLMQLVNGSDPRLQIVAARCLQRISGEGVTTKLTAALDAASPDAQAVLLEMLGQRGDKKAMAAVARYLEASNPEVRTAAIGAMRYIGDGSMVNKLAEIAAKSTGPERDAARESLKWMRGQDVDDAILASIGRGDERVSAELVRAAAVRLMKPALPAMLKFASYPDESIRVPVIYNIGKLATPEDLNSVLRAFARLEAGQNADTVKDALARICSRISDESERSKPLIAVLPTAEPAVQVVVLQALSTLRGQEALEAIRGCLESPSPQVKQAAAQALAEWGPVYCMDWVFAGPYKKSGASYTDLFDTVFPPETGDANVKWQPVKGQRGRNIDLQKLAQGEHICGYLRTQLVSQNEQEVILSFGSDDGIKVWLNGKLVHGNNATRGLRLDEDKVKVKLTKGENTLLVKVTQGRGDWAMACGVQSPVGGPPDALSFQAK